MELHRLHRLGRFEPTDERGFTLTEVLVAAVMATIAVLGLAHSFAMGRANLNRYATARAALALAQGRLEWLSSAATPGHNPGSPDLTAGTHSVAVMLGPVAATEQWVITWVNDPADGTPDSDPNDYKRATVNVMWPRADG